MNRRGCPFCHSKSSRVIGRQVDIWARCLNCRSVFRDISLARFHQIHDDSCPDPARIESTLAFAGQRPLRELWVQLTRHQGSVLQIGPGSGHLLAAARQAGCRVAAVEPSEAGRDLIRDLWNINATYPSLDAVPTGRGYDTILATDAFHRVYDVGRFLSAVRGLLAPGGRCYLSAPNAVSLEASVLGAWWAACRGDEQAAFPSPAGMATAARESGLRAGRIWSSGLPLEFPVAALCAARDRVRAQHGHQPLAARRPGRPAGATHPGGSAALTNFYSLASLVDPSYQVLGALGRAASLMAWLVQGPTLATGVAL